MPYLYILPYTDREFCCPVKTNAMNIPGFIFHTVFNFKIFIHI